MDGIYRGAGEGSGSSPSGSPACSRPEAALAVWDGAAFTVHCAECQRVAARGGQGGIGDDSGDGHFSSLLIQLRTSCGYSI
jgi:hypothetical protein